MHRVDNLSDLLFIELCFYIRHIVQYTTHSTNFFLNFCSKQHNIHYSMKWNLNSAHNSRFFGQTSSLAWWKILLKQFCLKSKMWSRFFKNDTTLMLNSIFTYSNSVKTAISNNVFHIFASKSRINFAQLGDYLFCMHNNISADLLFLRQPWWNIFMEFMISKLIFYNLYNISMLSYCQI